LLSAQERFRAEVRDAVTLHAFLLVCGVGLLQLAFIASYIGAFHQPTPHQVPISVIAPAPQAPRVIAELNALPGDPLKGTPVSGRAAGLAQLQDRTSYGLLEVSQASTTDRLTIASASGPSPATAVTAALQAAEALRHRRPYRRVARHYV
jgi:hypothetical protein